ncbi:hypothetical protein E1212_17015 [Jiangella ureilytica]|uniref:DUF3800 domain-containing protein n=1 Tax=Jiangella ureilytica TaxID=2530374 RepID=A0A4R4RK07_9ACTN|nr:hypothetical protein [Jiangella ureilytica]TDC49830.1 hypothetical protein E1212_17015 [Jiangella ureilytica]
MTVDHRPGPAEEVGQVTLHAFVDESFAGDYIVAAAVVPANDVNGARAAVRRLLRPGQERIHFKKESDARRAQILTGLEALDLTVRVYLAENGRDARSVCLERMVPDLATLGVTRLVLERSDPLVDADRRALFELTRKHACDLEYRHLRAHEDLLLCVADAVAWCYTKGGRWRDRVSAYSTVIRP